MINGIFICLGLLVICIFIIIYTLSNAHKRIKKKDKELNIPDGRTSYTYRSFKGLPDSKSFKFLGNGWITFEWRSKYYLAYTECNRISQTCLIEISEEQYKK